WRGIRGRRRHPPPAGWRPAGLWWVLTSVVRPPLIGRRYFRALVFHRDAAQWVILALGVAGPVVRHLDPGQRGVAVEDDAEEVPGFSLVPVIGRVGVDDGGDMRVRIGCGDLQVHHPVVGDGEQWVDGGQFPAGVVRIVHTADADAELEPQIRVDTHAGGHQWQVLAGHVDPQLLVLDHDLLHRGLEV